MSTSILRLYFMLSAIHCYGALVKGLRAEASEVGHYAIQGSRRFLPPPKKSSSMVFSVRNFGARANGRCDDSRVEFVPFFLPCALFLHSEQRGVRLAVLLGNLKATTDLSKYGVGAGWVEFAWIDGLELTGGGIFDGQGAEAWAYNDCHTNYHCKLLPINVKFVGMNRTVVQNITSLNSKFFHIGVVECRDFRGSNINISAPRFSPNTDGIHIERSSRVSLSSSVIGTGDDCISIGQGNSDVTVKNITCGPGHGISVGSLGKYPNEQDVNGLVVKDCKITGTSNGIRIKTWPNSPGKSVATNMIFENIEMKNVRNPIIIDQSYCPFVFCSSKIQAPSRVKLSDIYFKNIRGTSLSTVAVTLDCSKRNPCQNIYLEDVHLELSASKEIYPTSTCKNVKAKYIGTQIPAPCS
ncbi:hypothetical protein Ancab_017191 [Ancistrocladus abbreviatus]